MPEALSCGRLREWGQQTGGAAWR